MVARGLVDGFDYTSIYTIGQQPFQTLCNAPDYIQKCACIYLGNRQLTAVLWGIFGENGKEAGSGPGGPVEACRNGTTVEKLPKKSTTF